MDKRKTLEAKSSKCVVIARRDKSIYKVWVKERKCAIVAGHVNILENTFPCTGSFPMSSGRIENQSERSDVQRALMDRRFTPTRIEWGNTRQIGDRPNDGDGDDNQPQGNSEEQR